MPIYNEILQKSDYEKVKFTKHLFKKKTPESSTRNIKSLKIIAAGCIKKNTRSFSVILIRQKYVTIKHSGKLFNLFF